MDDFYVRVYWPEGGPSVADLGWARGVSAVLAAAPTHLAFAYLRTGADYVLGCFPCAEAERIRVEGAARGLRVVAERGSDYDGRYVEESLACPRQSDGEVRAVFRPSFLPEGAITVLRQKSDWRLELRLSNEHLWRARFSILPFQLWPEHQRGPGVRVATAEVPSSRMASFESLLSQATFKTPKQFGLDGMNVFVRSTLTEQHFEGDVWSPRRNTPEGALVVELIGAAVGATSDESLRDWLAGLGRYL